MTPLVIGLALALLGSSAFGSGDQHGPADQPSTHRPASGPVTWKRMSDSHRSSVDVPVSLVRSKPDELGLSFESLEGGASFQVFTITEARAGFTGRDPEGDMGLQPSDCDVLPPAYLVIKEKVAAYSCIRQGQVNYYLAKYTQWGSVTLLARYPVAQNALWAGVVSRMAASLRQVWRVEVGAPGH